MKKSIYVIILLSFPFSLMGQWLTDNEFGFKIQIPSNWSQEEAKQGSDKTYDFADPTQNIFIQVRAFKAQGITADQISKVFESQYLPNAKRLAFEAYTLNKTSGKFAGYTMHVDGLDVGIGAFYAVVNGNGYVIWSMIETKHYDQYSGQGDAIMNTFTTLSSSSKAIEVPTTFEITNMKLGTKLTPNYDISPRDEKTSFMSDQEKIYVIWDWEGKASGKNMSIRWFKDNREINAAKKNYKLPADKQGYGWANINKPSSGFIEGTYRVQIDFEGKKQKSIHFNIIKENAPSKQSSGNVKTAILTSGTNESCFSFKTGKLHKDHNNADIMVEPWCTEEVGVCGNWMITNETNLDAITSSPSSGYISDIAGYTDCQIMPTGKVAIVKLSDGSFAKMIIIKTEFSKIQNSSHPCQHKTTIKYQYPL